MKNFKNAIKSTNEMIKILENQKELYIQLLTSLTMELLKQKIKLSEEDKKELYPTLSKHIDKNLLARVYLSERDLANPYILNQKMKCIERKYNGTRN